MRKIGNWFIDKWLGSFLGGLSVYLVKSYFDLPIEERTGFFRFKWIIYFLNEETKLWKSLLIVSILIIIILVLIKKNSKLKRSIPVKSNIKNDPVLNYTRDIFGQHKSKWSWEYKFGSNDKLIVDDVTPLCPVCENKTSIVTVFAHKQYASCAKCRLEGRNPADFDLKETISDVSSEIVRLLNTGEWVDRNRKQNFLN